MNARYTRIPSFASRLQVSAKDIAWALSRKVEHHHDLLVLTVLASVSRDGWTFISQGTLAKRCMLCQRSVHRSLARLEQGGFLNRFERWRGNVRTSDHIHILAPSRCDSQSGGVVTVSHSIPSTSYEVRMKKKGRKRRHGLTVVDGGKA